ncbi:MAG: hypothetical protein ETSY2_23635 [Candidatus Entotheonella gemina]|uniref:DUF3500 domain-containing protein n=3 Tax=Candidatus Entotheonella TaxID=93171 RepID=W4M5Y7_9BACT|nr:MAG: hypothetical protein ETSY2_23635 [Candidatus Entotheonella gemina]
MLETPWSRRHMLHMLGLTAATLMIPFRARARLQEEMAQRARDLIDHLPDAQRRQALYPFEADERRDWHFFPRRRPGLALRDMTPVQRERVWALLGAGLSEQGLEKTRDVIRTEAILGELTGRRQYRDPENYAIVLFGDPASWLTAPWSWRFEGHHLSLTFTVIPDHGIAVTPAFVGANPATAPESHEHAGFKALGQEEAHGFGLLRSLSDSQRAKALIAPESFGNILTGPGREGRLKERVGLALGEMTAAQRQQTLTLIETYVKNVQPELAKRELDRLASAGIDAIHFAWAGSQQPGRPHYYRLHGPRLVIEYDNTQNGANHIHAVWHDPTNSFGQDLLRAHYEASHNKTQ